MNIVLFYPRGYDNSVGGKAISSVAVTMPPIGLLSIAAVLRKGGHSVTVIDAARQYQVENSEWIKRITALEPDCVGFSVITPSFHDAYEVCCGLKDRVPSIMTIFGGVHASCWNQLLLEMFPQIDCIVAGEGEYAFLDIANGMNVAEISGVITRDSKGIISGPRRTKDELCDMDDLPFPAYDLCEGFPEKYYMPLFSYPAQPVAGIFSSRGCVYQCSFCDRSVFHNSFRWNTPEYTFEMMKWLSTDFGVRHFMFYDDLFTLNAKRVRKLCSMLRESDMKITFNCIVRIGHIDDDLVRELKSAGCWMVHVGIESGDQDILDGYKLGLSLGDIRRDVERLHSAGIWVKGLFMMGFPGETVESIGKTMEFAKSLPLKDANCTAFTPYAGAPIYSRIKELGSFDDGPSNWKNLDCMNFVFVPKEIESKELLEKYYAEFIRGFYQRPWLRKVYWKMLFQSPHSFWRLIKNAPSFLGYVARMNRSG